MKKLISILGWLIFVLMGVGIIIFADHQGWLPGSVQEQAASGCRHGLDVQRCPFCSKEMVEKMGECTEHGVPEALCSRCNPALIPAFKVESDWCAEHNVPESQCLKCNPVPLSVDTGKISAGFKSEISAFPPASDLPRSRRPPDQTCLKNTLRVQFPSADMAKNAGLQFAQVQLREVSHLISCNAEIVYDRNLYARLAPRAAGVVFQVNKDLGDVVASGDVLAIVDSVDLGTAKAEYLQTLALVSLWKRNHSREQALLKKRVSTEREVLEAETRLVESRISFSRAGQRLKNLGLSEADIAALDKNRDTSSQLALAAPFAGTIVERAAVVGEVVGISKELFAMADISQMWAILDVYETDLAHVRTGLSVTVNVDGSRNEVREGIITWVSAHVDHSTRTLKARAELSNPNGMLKAGMFATAQVKVRGPEAAVVVPKAAVQWEGCCNIVFIRKSDVLYEPRKVRLGYDTGSWFVVEEGLAIGEQVVTTGSFLLKTEILKGSIGAGCCEIEPGKR
jgi:cobalt-zinc-cadmium efflux system membrane fusion protein